MKRVENLTERIADYDNLLEAYRKACRGKRGKKEVLAFADNLDENIASLRRQILSGHVDVGHYSHFTIFEPKQRSICAAAFHERVLHHAIINVCEEHFDRNMIDTTYATRRGKGVYAAIDKAVAAMSRYDYSVKLDVRKYYDSISHEVLMSMLRQKFCDPLLLGIFNDIVVSYSTSEGRGLPIGNLTSQYFANFYLSPLDHYIKERLRIPMYIRYMDDMLLACDSLDELHDAVRQVTAYLSENMLLCVKPPVYRRNKCGQSFLGYKVLPYRCELSGRSKRRFRTKYLRYERMFDEGVWSEQEYAEHILPLLAFVQHAVSRRFRESCMAQKAQRVKVVEWV